MNETAAAGAGTAGAASAVRGAELERVESLLVKLSPAVKRVSKPV